MRKMFLGLLCAVGIMALNAQNPSGNCGKDGGNNLTWELNLSTIRWCMGRLGIACEISPTSEFSLPGTVADDFREAIHPKRPCTVLESLGLEKPYYQVFRDRMGGFTPGMSCLDLLFNEGPDSILSLKKI